MARRKEPNLGTLLGLGSTAVAFLIGGMAIGWFVDSRIGTFPVIALAGLGLGIAGACVYTFVELKRFL